MGISVDFLLKRSGRRRLRPFAVLTALCKTTTLVPGAASCAGLHYQVRHAQGKLVRAVAGEIFDVAVDMRRGSRILGVGLACI